MILDSRDTKTIPILIIFDKSPFSYKIHIDICEKRFPKFEVYISNNLLIIPDARPIISMLKGFNIYFFIFIPIKTSDFSTYKP